MKADLESVTQLAPSCSRGQRRQPQGPVPEDAAERYMSWD